MRGVADFLALVVLVLGAAAWATAPAVKGGPVPVVVHRDDNGCEYLVVPGLQLSLVGAGISPRLDRDGKQICAPVEQGGTP